MNTCDGCGRDTSSKDHLCVECRAHTNNQHKGERGTKRTLPPEQGGFFGAWEDYCDPDDKEE